MDQQQGIKNRVTSNFEFLTKENFEEWLLNCKFKFKKEQIEQVWNILEENFGERLKKDHIRGDLIELKIPLGIKENLKEWSHIENKKEGAHSEFINNKITYPNIILNAKIKNKKKNISRAFIQWIYPKTGTTNSKENKIEFYTRKLNWKIEGQIIREIDPPKLLLDKSSPIPRVIDVPSNISKINIKIKGKENENDFLTGNEVNVNSEREAEFIDFKILETSYNEREKKYEGWILIFYFYNEQNEIIKSIETNPIQVVAYSKHIYCKNIWKSILEISNNNVLKFPSHYPSNSNEYRYPLEFMQNYAQLINFKDNSGYTLLHWSSGLGDEKLTKYCLENGFDINAKDFYGCTAFYWAVWNENESMVSLLLSYKDTHKLDINLGNDYGITPLHLAYYFQNKSIIQLLIQNGASEEIEDIYGNIPSSFDPSFFLELCKLGYSLFGCENQESFSNLKAWTEKKLENSQQEQDIDEEKKYSDELVLMRNLEEAIIELKTLKVDQLDDDTLYLLQISCLKLMDIGLKKYTPSPKKLDRLLKSHELKKEYEEQKQNTNLDNSGKLSLLETLLHIQKFFENPINLSSLFSLNFNYETNLDKKEAKNRNPLCQANNLMNKDKETKFQEKMNRVKSIPDCKEKRLMVLKFLLHVISQPNVCNLNEMIQQLEEEIQKLIEDLKLEEIYSIEPLIEKMKQEVNLKNFEFAQLTFKELSKSLMPFNIFKAEHLIQLSEKFCSIEFEQNVILFYGKTGSGKTTTIHYLAGSKMEVVQSKTVNHIAPIEVKNLALKNSTVSASSKSETKYLTAVPIFLKGERFILCDSPGTGDTRGAERDVACGISTMKYLQKAKTVRLVLLFSYRDGGRAEGIIQLTQTLTQCVINLLDKLGAFCYLFTQFPELDHDQLLKFAQDIRKRGNDVTELDAIFRDMESKLNSEQNSSVFIVKPLDGKPDTLLTKILEITTPINKPSEVFQNFVPNEVQATVEKQARLLKRDILQFSKKPEKFSLLYPKIYQLKTMARLLNNNVCQTTLDDVLQQLKTDLQSMCNQELELLERTLDDNNNLTLEDIQRFISFVNYCSYFDKLKELSSQLTLPSKSNMIDNLSKKIDQLFTQYDFSSKFAESRLKKLSLLCSQIHNFSNKYESIIMEINQAMKMIIKEGQNALRQEGFNDFTSVAEKLEKLHILSKLLSSVLKTNYSSEIRETESTYSPMYHSENDQTSIQTKNGYDELMYGVKAYLNQLNKKLVKLLKQPLTEELIKNILDLKKIIINAKKTENLHQFLPKKEINKIHDQFIEVLVKYIEKELNQLQIKEDRINLESILINSKLIFEKIDQLRHEIPKLASKTEMLYNENFSSLLRVVGNYSTNAEEAINKLGEKNLNSTLKGLEICLQILDSAKWIEKFQPSSYSFLNFHLHRKFDEIIQELEIKLKYLNFTLDDIEELSILSSIIQQIDGLIKLEKYLPEKITNKAKEVKATFMKKITKLMYSMEHYFNLEKKTKNFYEIKVKKVENRKTELLSEKNQNLEQNQSTHENSIPEIENNKERSLRKSQDDIKKKKCKKRSNKEKVTQKQLDCKKQNMTLSDEKKLSSVPKQVEGISLEELEVSIEKKNKKLQVFGNREYYFEPLDYNYCEKCINFLNSCISHFIFKNEAQKQKNQIEEYLKTWKQFIEREIGSHWKFITSYHSNGESKFNEQLSDCTIKIFHSLQLLKKIKDKSPLTFQIIDGDELFIELCDKFRNYYFTCNLTIPTLEFSKQISELEKLNHATSYLKLFDSFLEHQNWSFENLNKILETTLSKCYEKIELNVKNLLEQRNFVELALALKRTSETNRSKLMEIVTMKISALSNKLKKDLKLLSFYEINMNVLIEIEDSFDFIFNIFEQLKEFWEHNYKQNLDKLITDTEESLYQFFQKHLNDMNKLIQRKQKKEANEKFSSIHKWINQFKNIKKIKELQNEFHKIEITLNQE